MNKIIVYFCIIIILLIIFFKKKERFVNKEDVLKIKEGLRLNYEHIENLNDLEVLEIPDTSKILLKGMIKNYFINNSLFQKNLSLEDKKIVYNLKEYESIYNSNLNYLVTNPFKTDKNNNYYGIQFQYKPGVKNIEDIYNNRFSISIEYHSIMELHLKKIEKINQLQNSDEYKNLTRVRVEAFGPETKRSEFYPYFKDTGVKGLVLFKDPNNLDFIKYLDGYFNLNDYQGNRILTKCKLDSPFCKTHLPSQNPIYGRDKYNVTKFYPYDDKFKVI